MHEAGGVTERLLIVSPVRNEAAHIERIARSVAAQTRRPEHWMVVDDGSDDEHAADRSRRSPREIAFMQRRLDPAGFTVARRATASPSPRRRAPSTSACDASRGA